MIRRTRPATVGDRAFPVADRRLWNSRRHLSIDARRLAHARLFCRSCFI